MKTINDLVARAKRRKGKKAETLFNGHRVSANVDGKDRVTWRVQGTDGKWNRLGYGQLQTKLETKGSATRAAA